MHPTAKNILPIFNKKKRPRQALVTYPNKTNEPNNTGGGLTQNQSFQLSNKQSQPGYLQLKQPQNTHHQPNHFKNTANSFATIATDSGNNNRACKGSNSAGGNSQPRFLGHPRPEMKVQHRKATTSTPNKNALMQQRQQQQHPRQSQYNQWTNQTPYGGSSTHQKSNQMQCGGGGGGWGNNKQLHRFTQQPGNSIQPNPTTSYQMPSRSTPNKRQYMPGFVPTKNKPTGHTPVHIAGQYGARNGAPANMFNVSNSKAVLLPFQGSGTDGTEDTPSMPMAPPPPPDKTMKILTSSIEGMKHWSQYTNHIGLLLFELFGILNSAISTNESGSAKMFSLKDGEQSQKCIFYETDRKLLRLTRGQFLRCCGNLDRKTGLFRVVKVRRANQQEQAMSTAIITKCDLAMNERLAEMQEQ